MMFLGDEAISRATRVSSRTVLIVSATLFVFSMQWVTVPENKILGLRFEVGYIDWALRAVVLYNLITHIVLWYGDYVGYRGWNIYGKQPDKQTRIESSGLNNLNALFVDLDFEARACQDGGLISKPLRLSSPLNYRLKTLNASIGHFGLFARFYVWGWFMALPVGSGILALIASFCVSGNT